MDIHLLEVIDKCLKFADPELPAYARLTSLREKVEHNIMLGPQARRFLRLCIEAQDNIDCEKLGLEGRCKIPRVGECGFRATEEQPGMKFKHCPYYGQKKAEMKGHPLSKL
jgi:hypothetical protein